MPHTKTPGTGNKIKFVLLWIVSYIGVSLCSLMPSAATSLVASVKKIGEHTDSIHTFNATQHCIAETQRCHFNIKMHQNTFFQQDSAATPEPPAGFRGVGREEIGGEDGKR